MGYKVEEQQELRTKITELGLEISEYVTKGKCFVDLDTYYEFYYSIEAIKELTNKYFGMD